jgi:flagellar assembly protein FliH
MTLSTDATPARVHFPQVRTAGQSTAQDSGYIQGHAAGYAAGLRAAAAEQELQSRRRQAEHEAVLTAAGEASDRAVAVLTSSAAAFQQRFELVLQDAEAVLAASAIDLAEAVVGYELHDGERSARGALRRALGNSGHGTAPQVAAVRLNPADLQILEAIDGAAAARDAGVELVPDPSLARGDAMARYPDGWLDARLGAALDRARAALLEQDHQAQPAELPAPGPGGGQP